MVYETSLNKFPLVNGNLKLVLSVIKRFKKSKLAKFAWKGLTLLQNML